MIKRTKEIFKKLEIGILELLVGALMIIGLIGYFGTVPADLDWIDHTVSFILFSYLFYQLNITAILFGKSLKIANAAIVISFFSLFFKDIISYTALDAFNFKVIKFIDYFYVFFRDNLTITNIVTFHIGVIGILLASIYITKKIEISSPSFLHALYSKPIKNKFVKFLLIFISLLGFYYFVYNLVMEWLEFTLDDPVVAVGVVFYIWSVAKHHEKFSKEDFVFKIGDFSTKLYSRFVSLFHYRKTLLFALSGLLIFHALADLSVFAFSMTFFKENFYLAHLGGEHTPFLKLFFEDMKEAHGFSVLPLLITYLLNNLSLIIFLLIPIVIWVRMFLQKELHFNRALLFFIYSSIMAYALLPGYKVIPLGGEAIKGADIVSVSLFESSSFLDNFFLTKSTTIFVVCLISLLAGLIAYLLSLNHRIKKELYALSIIGGLIFYTFYLYYFFTSLASYLYENILATILTPYFLIGATLAIFLLLSVIFYAGGYLVFLYEVVMEYHKRKWSDPIDEELVAAVKKIRNIKYLKHHIKNKERSIS